MPVEGRHAVAPQVGDQALAPLAAPEGRDGELAGDEPLDPGLARLGDLGSGAVVADVRLGHHHDLAAVGGVGEHLLVAGHRGVEHHLAEAGAGRDGLSLEDAAVFEDEEAG